MRGLAALGFAGANVTAPHKQAVLRSATTSTRRRHSGSVNTLVFDGRVEATSADARILDGEAPRHAVVLGARRARLLRSSTRCGGRERLSSASRGGSAGRRCADDADLVVNATPVREEVLVELRPGQTLVDLPYPMSATADAARAAGARVLDGLDVLVAQGAASFELWTGVPAPLEVTRAASAADPEPRGDARGRSLAGDDAGARHRRRVARARAGRNPHRPARRAAARPRGDRRRPRAPPAGVRTEPAAAHRARRGRGASPACATGARWAPRSRSSSATATTRTGPGP